MIKNVSFISLIVTLLIVTGQVAASEKLTIAAASDLRYALTDIIALYKKDHPEQVVEVVFGSSGKMTNQIMNGAPYDVFFSADISYPEKLHTAGFTAGKVTAYALGRIVLWSHKKDASQLKLEDFLDASIKRIAIANPIHAPYGVRAKEALQAAGLWDAVQHKLVFGENIARTAQMIESEAADVGIIALSLALFPGLTRHGYRLIDDHLHHPLTQAYVVTQYGEANKAALAFVRFMEKEPVHTIMKQYGFSFPKKPAKGSLFNEKMFVN
ncbi:Molybdenum ABC transporter, substrate-binding protein ModA [hydrothermal vent metagenome]|uniref:Molybdenum ABC transporter, substrate-binding protein ModA n=1 Tax=hydrothermal vent metagenome TaxID=652676 RepID=A0A3B0Z1F8_9ZZZZ